MIDINQDIREILSQFIGKNNTEEIINEIKLTILNRIEYYVSTGIITQDYSDWLFKLICENTHIIIDKGE